MGLRWRAGLPRHTAGGGRGLGLADMSEDEPESNGAREPRRPSPSGVMKKTNQPIIWAHGGGILIPQMVQLGRRHLCLGY